MDAKLKTKWVEALRSGEYKQGICALRSGDLFCCLGVALDIQGAAWDGGAASLNGHTMYPLEAPPGIALGNLPLPDVENLMSKNDGISGERRHSFSEIADYIEANL